MELNNIYEVISQYSSLVAPAVVIILFFTRRALFLNVIWQNLFKKDYEFNDDALGAAAKQQIDVEKFRLLFPKLKVRSIYHAKAIITWCNHYKIGYEEAATQADHLHYNEHKTPKISLTLPKSLNLYQSMNMSMIAALGLFLCFILFIPSLSGWSDKILVKGKYSSTFLWIKNDASLASTFMADKQWEIKADECKDTAKGRMDQKERAALCDLVSSDDKMRSFFDKSRRESLITSIILLILGTLPLVVFIKSYYRNKALKRLYRYISSIKPSNTDSSDASQNDSQPSDNAQGTTETTIIKPQ